MLRILYLFYILIFATHAIQAQFSAGDRLLNGSFKVSYYNRTNTSKDIDDNKNLSSNFNIKSSWFVSKHWALGGGIHFGSYKDIYIRKAFNNEQTIFKIWDFSLQLSAQYYKPINKRFYFTTQINLTPTVVEISGSKKKDATGSTIAKSKLTPNTDNQLVINLIPSIGYSISKHWLMELDLVNFSFSNESNNNSSTKTSHNYTFKLQFEPSVFNFHWVYLWSSASKSSRSTSDTPSVSQPKSE